MNAGGERPFIERALERTDRARTRPVWLFVTTLVIAALWFLPLAPDRVPEEAVTQVQGPLRGLLFVWWATAIAFAVSFAREGSSARTRALELVTEVAAAFASVAAIFAARTLATPVWLIAFGRAFAWWPRRRAAAQASRWAMVASHLALAGWWVAEGYPSGGIIVLVLLAGQEVVLRVSSQLVRQRLELEAESEALHRELEALQVRRDSDRIARELHDGLGAELVALNLSLRGKGPTARPHQEKVLGLLDELRGVVWSLRGGQGSFGEFEKVVGAQVRATSPSMRVTAPVPAVERSLPVAPDEAFAVLHALHALGQAVTFESAALVTLVLERRPLAVVVRGLPAACVPDVVASLRRGAVEVAGVDDGALRIGANEPT